MLLGYMLLLPYKAYSMIDIVPCQLLILQLWRFGIQQSLTHELYMIHGTYNQDPENLRYD